MRRSIVLFATILLAVTVSAHAADKPPFLMQPVEPPPGWRYEGCVKTGEANGQPIMGGPNCRLVETQQNGHKVEPGYAERDRDERSSSAAPRRNRYQQWAEYCRQYYWYDPRCRPQPTYAYAAPAVDWRGVEYFWGKVLGERPRRHGWHQHHRGGGHQGWGGRDQRIGSSGGYDPRNPSGGQRRR